MDIDEAIRKSISREELVRAGAISMGLGFITADGRYWSQLPGSEQQSWFTSFSEPKPIWAHLWAKLAIREVMES